MDEVNVPTAVVVALIVMAGGIINHWATRRRTAASANLSDAGAAKSMSDAWVALNAEIRVELEALKKRAEAAEQAHQDCIEQSERYRLESEKEIDELRTKLGELEELVKLGSLFPPRPEPTA